MHCVRLPLRISSYMASTQTVFTFHVSSRALNIFENVMRSHTLCRSKYRHQSITSYIVQKKITAFAFVVNSNGGVAYAEGNSELLFGVFFMYYCLERWEGGWRLWRSEEDTKFCVLHVYCGDEMRMGPGPSTERAVCCNLNMDLRHSPSLLFIFIRENLMTLEMCPFCSSTEPPFLIVPHFISMWCESVSLLFRNRLFMAHCNAGRTFAFISYLAGGYFHEWRIAYDGDVCVRNCEKHACNISMCQLIVDLIVP